MSKDAALEEDLVDYEDDEETLEPAAGKDVSKAKTKGSYVSMHTISFRDLLLKPEILRAIQECGFEHPSEVQQECIPQAILGVDVICQAKSGMGKTAVFVLSTLQQIEKDEGCNTLVLCHTRELAYQICQEFNRFKKYLQDIKVAVLYGGHPVKDHRRILQEENPNIIVGTPGRTLALIKEGVLKVDKLKRFILDECDSLLQNLDIRADVQAIFKHTPKDKQVMLFSATIDKDMRTVARKFAKDPMEVFVDNENNLTLHGLVQYYAKLNESEKNRKLSDLLDNLEFNQIIIFVSSARRAIELNKLLVELAFPSMCIHSKMKQEERIEIYSQFKKFKSRILVSTDLFGRGVDIERVNVVVNYDMPKSSDQYLHRVGRAGRFGTKGLAISFIASDEDTTVLDSVQARFEVKIGAMPDSIDASTYTQS